MANWKHNPNNKNPIIHNITRADCNAAAKGLNMLSMRIAELDALIKLHGHGRTFADQAITAAAQQMREVKKFNCAE